MYTDCVWPSQPAPSRPIVEGMLQFDETAAYWAGPFEGGYRYFRLADMQQDARLGSSPTVAELQQQQRSAATICRGACGRNTVKTC